MSKKKSNTKKTKIDLIDLIFIVAPFMQGLLPIWSLALLSIVCLRWNNI